MRDIIVFAIVFGGLPIAMVRPFVGLLLFTWLAYMRPQDMCWGFARGMAFSQFIAIAMLSGWLIFDQRPLLRRAPPVKWVILLFVWVSLSMFANPMEGGPRQIARWMDLAKVLLIAMFTIGQLDTKSRLRAFLWVIAVSLGFFGVKCGLFGLLTGGRINQGPGGMLKDNNDFCLALNMNLPVMYYLGKATTHKLLRRGLYIAAVLTVVAVIITQSRGGLLTMVAILWLIVWRSKYRFVAIGMGMVMALIVLILLPSDIKERYATLKDPTQESSAASRLYAWGIALNMVKANPMLGVGMNNFLANFRRYEENAEERPGGPKGDEHVAHNTYFQVWAESGTPSLVFFLAMILTTAFLMRRLRSVVRSRAGPAWFSSYTLMVETSLIAFLVGATFLNRVHFDLLYHIVAVGCVLYRLMPSALAEHAEEKRRDRGDLVVNQGVEVLAPGFAFGMNR